MYCGPGHDLKLATTLGAPHKRISVNSLRRIKKLPRNPLIMSVGSSKIILPEKKGTPMGTRNLTVVKDKAGINRIAQYGQWDGYPSYSGIQALEFLRDEGNQALLSAKLDLVQFVGDEEVDTLYKQYETTDWENKDFLNAYPGLHRDTGIGILSVVANAIAPIKTVDNTEFAKDDLFCEGVYEVDFSTNKFITIYDSKVVEYDLDNLPSDKDYLSAFEVEQLV
jgi:hypothetical protein